MHHLETVNGELIVVGDFLHVNGELSSFIAAWRSTTPVLLSDFNIASSPAGVMLEWKLFPESIPEISSLQVQRSGYFEGPYENISEPLVPERVMQFSDPTSVAGQVYWYRLSVWTRGGAIEVSRALSTSLQGFAESILYPPVLDGGRVQVRYRLGGQAREIQLGVFDVRGRLIRSLATGHTQPGEHRVLWDRTAQSGHAVGRGVYFLRLQSPGTQLSRKVILSVR